MTRIESYLGASAADTERRVLHRIRRYVEHESPSHDAQRINQLAALLEAELTDIGAIVERIDAPGLGSNVLARINQHGAAGRPLLMLAHMDTVHPVGTITARPFREIDGRAEGPGIYDMKAGLAIIMESLHWHRTRGSLLRPITVLMTCDEEVGSHSSRELIERLARDTAAVLVPEPCMPDGGVKTGRKGVATYRLRTTGRAAHAGIEPGTAISATAELVHQCSRVLQLVDHGKGTTINIGTISGGTATNVVAAEASAGIDVRLAMPGEGERIHEALMTLAAVTTGASVSVTLSESRPPLLRTNIIADAYAMAKRCASDLGVELAEGTTGGGSDGSFAAAVGAAVLDGLGPRGGGAHAADEHIVVSDLPFRLALMCNLIEVL